MIYRFFDIPTQFSLTLDGARYYAYIRWNFAGERWYIVLTDETGDLIMNAPVIESTRDEPIDLLAGYGFTNTLIFNDTIKAFEVI